MPLWVRCRKPCVNCKARELHPLAAIVNHDLRQTLAFARRCDEALAQCNADLDLNPTSARTSWVMRNVYAAKGIESEAVSCLLLKAERSRQ